MTATHDLPTLGPAVLAKYEPVRYLGEGGAGVVIEARQRSLGRSVALKLLPPCHAGDVGLRRRFAREARVLSSLAHPGVVVLLDYGFDGDVPYLAEELLRGCTLQQRLARDGLLAADEAVAIGRAVAETLAHVHRLGVIHRDIKPANIFLAADGSVKLIDFGLARAEACATALTVTGDLVGSPAFMAPELLVGQPPTPAADMHGLGATLFQVLSGRLPVEATGVSDLLRRGARPKPSLASVARTPLPPRLCALVDALLRVEPAARPDAAAAAADLGAPGPPADARPGPQSARLPLALGLLALAAAVILWQPGRTPDGPGALGVGPSLERLERPLLQGLGHVALRYRGSREGALRFEVREVGPERRLLLNGSFDLARAHQGPGQVLTEVVPLRQPLLGPAEVRFVPADPASATAAPRTPPRTFALDPAELLDHALRGALDAVDRLRGPALASLATALDQVRRDPTLRNSPASADAFVAGRLEQAGLGPVDLAALRLRLAAALGADALPGSPLGRRLLPLRQLEAILPYVAPGVTPPWGALDQLLGIVRLPTSMSLPTPQPPWSLAAAWQCPYVAGPGGRRVRALRWLLSSRYWEVSTTVSTAAFLESGADALQHDDENIPAMKTMPSTLRIELPPVDAGAGARQPRPGRAVLELIVRGLTRDQYLSVAVNQSTTCEVAGRGGIPVSWQRLSLPLDPSCLGSDATTLDFTVQALPVRGSLVMPVAFAAAAVRVAP